MLFLSVKFLVSNHTWYTNLSPRSTVLVLMFSASLFLVWSAYGLAFVSVYSSCNSSSSSINFVPVRSNFSLLRTNFSGWNTGVSGGVILLLNSLSAVPSVALPLASTPPVETTLVTVVNVWPFLATSTVIVAFIVSYTIPASLAAGITSSTV